MMTEGKTRGTGVWTGMAPIQLEGRGSQAEPCYRQYSYSASFEGPLPPTLSSMGLTDRIMMTGPTDVTPG